MLVKVFRGNPINDSNSTTITKASFLSLLLNIIQTMVNFPNQTIAASSLVGITKEVIYPRA